MHFKHFINLSVLKVSQKHLLKYDLLAETLQFKKQYAFFRKH